MDLTITDSDFLCRCTPEEEKRCDAVLAAAREKCQWRDKPLTDIQFMDALLYRLTDSGIEFRVASDQWAAVFVSLYRFNKELGQYGQYEKEPYSTARLQCDSIVDGLAAAYLWVEQQNDSHVMPNFK